MIRMTCGSMVLAALCASAALAEADEGTCPLGPYVSTAGEIAAGVGDRRDDCR